MNKAVIFSITAGIKSQLFITCLISIIKYMKLSVMVYHTQRLFYSSKVYRLLNRNKCFFLTFTFQCSYTFKNPFNEMAGKVDYFCFVCFG